MVLVCPRSLAACWSVLNRDVLFLASFVSDSRAPAVTVGYVGGRSGIVVEVVAIAEDDGRCVWGVSFGVGSGRWLVWCLRRVEPDDDGPLVSFYKSSFRPEV